MRKYISSPTQGIPGESRSANDARVRVVCSREVARVVGQYIERPRSFRLIWEYIRHLGPLAVARKVVSRSAEGHRNNKISSVGLGVVWDARESSPLKPGELVGFFAPNHPANRHWLVIDERFIVRMKEAEFVSGPEQRCNVFDELLPYLGWSPLSGFPVDTLRIEWALRTAIAGSFSKTDLPLPSTYREDAFCAPPERVERAGNPKERPRAVLFGLGNYAKVQVVPYIRRTLDLACVHEIDPLQIKTARGWGVALDTSPWPREDERYDAWFIAGYHHTHAPIATEALRRGGYAVVEKPLATTWEQFAKIQSLVSHADHGKLIVAFQRRYTPMNDWAWQDLSVNSGDPVNYHCIVYEIPLPKRHWYNWPNSRSRLTSNGCHWIDHFLFLNGYPTVNDYKVHTVGSGDMFVIMEADNGASFSMVLTEQGSERLGVRDYVELRANGVTVRMIDQARYESESSLKYIRSHRLNPTHAYARLYETASNIIINHGRGDDFRSLESTRVTLLLEDALASKTASFSGSGKAPAEPTDEQSRSIDYYP